MADPLTDLEELALVIAAAKLQRRRVTREAAMAMHDVLTDWLLADLTAQKFDAAELLSDFRDRIVAGRRPND